MSSRTAREVCDDEYSAAKRASKRAAVRRREAATRTRSERNRRAWEQISLFLSDRSVTP